MSKKQRYDVVVIGAGHNGLVCAAYLAKAGLNVLVLERRSIVGGACTTEEVFPGVRFSSGANSYGMLRPKIIQDLELERFGLNHEKGDVYITDPIFFLPFPDTNYFVFWRNFQQLQQEVGRFSQSDAAHLEDFYNEVDFGTKILERFILHPPATKEQMKEHLSNEEWLLIEKFRKASVNEILSRYFESEYVKAAFAATTILFKAGPYTPGTALSLLYLNLAEVGGKAGGGFARGGMGRITQALSKAINSLGVKVKLSTEVKKILVEKGKAYGIELSNGEQIRATIVVSNADPKYTFLTLIEEKYLPPLFLEDVKSMDTEGICSKLNCVLTELPKFENYQISNVDILYNGTTIIGASLPYIQRAYEDVIKGLPSEEPYLELIIQSYTDNSLVSRGKHYLSVYVQFTPYHLKQGKWDDPTFCRVYEERIINTIAKYAPNIYKVMTDQRDFLSPLEIERRFGMTEGNPDHINMSPESMFYQRPYPGYADYRTPISHLYLCGVGTQPGGLVSGAPGHNSAMKITSDWPKM